jgi:60 kDa SS-A/Ro ribonucleoprotein
VPSQWLGEAEVWRALLPKLPLTALLRNLARMTANGALRTAGVRRRPTWSSAGWATARRCARRASTRSQCWRRSTPTRRARDARRAPVDANPEVSMRWIGRSTAFGNVEATGKRIVLALDVSGSMSGGLVAGVAGFDPARGRRGDGAGHGRGRAAGDDIVGFSHAMVPLAISSTQRLDDVVRLTIESTLRRDRLRLADVWALEAGVKADAFVVYTDSETWFGQIHPVQALQEYRPQDRHPAKLVVVAMTSNGFTIADPNDAGMLDVVGFDAAAPQVISGFISGE